MHLEQLYLLANALILFFIFSAVWRRTRRRLGFTFAVFLLVCGVPRFCLEFFRDPAAGGASTGLSSSQWMGVAYVIDGTALLTVCRRAETVRQP